MDELIHKGHRQRMRRKLNDYGPRVFDTYELLEMLLYRTVVKKDTNPHSKRLLARFGSLEGVFSASQAELVEVEGIGKKAAELISAVAEVLPLCEASSNNAESVLDDYDELGRNLVDYFDGKEMPSVVIMTLDNSMRLIALDELYSIDYSSAGVKPGAFVDTAIKRRATVAIVAHNHPFGPICPTEGDRVTNSIVEKALLDVGVVLAEHYVVAGDRYIGFMNRNMNNLFEQRPALEKFRESKRRSGV